CSGCCCCSGSCWTKAQGGMMTEYTGIDAICIDCGCVLQAKCDALALEVAELRACAAQSEAAVARDELAALCVEAVPLLSQIAAMLWQHGMGWESWALKAQDLQARMSGDTALAQSVAKAKEAL